MNPALLRIRVGRGIAVHCKPLKIDALQTLITDATERRLS